MGFKCEHVIIANCDFSPSAQLLERNVYITCIRTYVRAVVHRGENIMLQNLGIMLFFDAHNMCQLCSANNFIMLQKYAIMHGKNSTKQCKTVKNTKN